MKYICLVIFIFNLIAISHAGIPDTINVSSVILSSSSYKSNERLDSVVSEHPFYSLSELLENESFVQENHAGGKGALTTISVRGLTSNHTNVLWNGLNINSLTLGSVNLGGVPVSVSDNVTLIKGNAISTINQVSIGGAVLMESKLNWNKPLDVTIGSQIGSFGCFGSNTSFGFSKKQWITKIGYTYAQSENDYTFENFKKIGKPLERQSNASYYTRNILVSNGWRNKKRTLVISNHIWFGERFSEIPKTYSGNTPSQAFTQDTAIRSVTSVKTAIKKVVLNIVHGLNHQRYLYKDEPYGINTFYVLSTNQFSGQAKYSFYRWKFSILNESRFQVADNNQYGNREERIMNFAKINVSKSLANNKANVFGTGVYTSILNNESFPNGNIGYTYQHKNQLFNGGGGTHYRVPSFNDLFWPSGGNTQIKSEKGWNIEQSWECIKTIKKMSLKTGVEAYYSIVNNWIQWTAESGGLWSVKNLKRVRASGISSKAIFSLKSKDVTLHLFNRMDYSRTIVVESDLMNDPGIGMQALYTPLIRFKNKLSLVYKRLVLSLDQNYFGRRFKTLDNIKSQSIAPYLLHNIEVKRSFQFKTYNFISSLSILNLNNHSYEGVNNRPMPGRSVYAALILKL